MKLRNRGKANRSFQYASTSRRTTRQSLSQTSLTKKVVPKNTTNAISKEFCQMVTSKMKITVDWPQKFRYKLFDPFLSEHLRTKTTYRVLRNHACSVQRYLRLKELMDRNPHIVNGILNNRISLTELRDKKGLFRQFVDRWHDRAPIPSQVLEFIRDNYGHSKEMDAKRHGNVEASQRKTNTTKKTFATTTTTTVCNNDDSAKIRKNNLHDISNDNDINVDLCKIVDELEKSYVKLSEEDAAKFRHRFCDAVHTIFCKRHGYPERALPESR